MALFPSAKFEILLAGRRLVAGEHAEGELVVTTEEDIPRAKHVDLVFHSVAQARDYQRKSLGDTREELFTQAIHVELPETLAKGSHRFPFTLDPPESLPPSFVGVDCEVTHFVVARIDVDWALDPHAKVFATLVRPPRTGERTPVSVRSPRRFHEDAVVELSLASTVIAQGESLFGKVAVHASQSLKLGALTLTMSGVAAIAMGIGDERKTPSRSSVTIKGKALRSGEPVTFELPGPNHLAPTFESKAVDHRVFLEVVLGGNSQPFQVPLTVLPHGSTITGDAFIDDVGTDRTRQLARDVAQATGLHEGLGGVLAKGGEGIVLLRIAEIPRDGGFALEVSYSYPDLELGITFRPLGPLEGFRESPLLPPGGFENYLLRATHPEATRELMAAFLGDIDSLLHIDFSDTALHIETRLTDDSPEHVIALAKRAVERAKTIARAIDAVPFPEAVRAAEEEWRLVGAEEEAGLVPIGPAIHSIERRYFLAAGEERTFHITLRTRWKKDVPHDRIVVDLREAPLPDPAIEVPAALSARFSSVAVSADGALLTIDRPDFSMNPRALWPALEEVMAWVLDVRGEQRSSMPYR